MTRGGLPAYLASTGLWGIAISMQQLLVPWLLIAVLSLPAAQVGAIQAVIGIPGLFLILWGGAAADRSDPRRLLTLAYAFAPVLQVGLIAADLAGLVNTFTVAAWGLGMSAVIAFTAAPHSDAHRQPQPLSGRQCRQTELPSPHRLPRIRLELNLPGPGRQANQVRGEIS